MEKSLPPSMKNAFATTRYQIRPDICPIYKSSDFDPVEWGLGWTHNYSSTAKAYKFLPLCPKEPFRKHLIVPTMFPLKAWTNWHFPLVIIKSLPTSSNCQMPIGVCRGTAKKSEHHSSALNPLPRQRVQKSQTTLAKALLVCFSKSSPDGSLLRDVHHRIRMCNEVLKRVLQAHDTVQELFSRLKWPLPALQ